jgi:hypothetical protein
MIVCGRTVSATLLAAMFMMSACAARAQEIEPRAYSNVPVGVNFLIAGLANSSGGLVTDPSLPIENADLKTDAMLLAYARGMDFHGHSGKVDAVLPFGWLEGSAVYGGDTLHRRVGGFGDPRLRISINLLGAPALPLAKMGSYQQQTIVGVSAQITVPLGQYDDTRLLNIGMNRWTLKTELGVSKAAGNWTLEIAPSATFFSDNDDFYGGHRRAQEPVYAVQGSVIYGLRRGSWLALSGTYYTGGRTSIDDGAGRNLQNNSLLMATLALPIDRKNSVKLSASTGLVTRTGSDADTIAVGWQHRWGGGL